MSPEQREPWPPPGSICSADGCRNDAEHDWVVAWLCGAHDLINNLMLKLEQCREEGASDLPRPRLGVARRTEGRATDVDDDKGAAWT